MTKSLEHIKQNLNNLELAVTETAVELEKYYQSYLNVLSLSVKQQLILASYQICTQFYPQAFLNLSLSNKQDLQQLLRHIGIDLKPILDSILAEKELEPEPKELNLMTELIKNLPKPKKRKGDEKEEEEEAEEGILTAIDYETVKAQLGNIELIAIDTSLQEQLEVENTEAETEKQAINPRNPEHLILWHKQIERKIKKTLDSTSKKVNKLLQDSGIIPDRVPSKIIDVAIQTDANGGNRNSRQLPNLPNILHLAIESEKENHNSALDTAFQISLLRLRLAEIEFSDHSLNAQRGQIQKLINQIKKLNYQYISLKHEVAVAEAQAAWRSCWYED
ncbi:hypothetical protein NIES4102_25580 [Chondrocystis sp. NIES-4102]|nr:hypothetical protein NIES4102_25580 [Chondrocystis sp. NIES-4102]